MKQCKKSQARVKGGGGVHGRAEHYPVPLGTAVRTLPQERGEGNGETLHCAIVPPSMCTPLARPETLLNRATAVNSLKGGLEA